MRLVAYPALSLNFSHCATSLECISSRPPPSRSISKVAHSSDQPGTPRIETPPQSLNFCGSSIERPPQVPVLGHPLRCSNEDHVGETFVSLGMCTKCQSQYHWSPLFYWHGERYVTASATTNTPHNAVLLFHATTSQRRACACTSPVCTSRDTIPELLLGTSPPGPRSLSTTITTGTSLFSRPPLPPFSRAPRSLPRCLSFFFTFAAALWGAFPGCIVPPAPGLKLPTDSAHLPPFKDVAYVPPQSSLLFPVSALHCSSTKFSIPASTPVVPPRSPLLFPSPLFVSAATLIEVD